MSGFFIYSLEIYVCILICRYHVTPPAIDTLVVLERQLAKATMGVSQHHHLHLQSPQTPFASSLTPGP